MAFLLTPWLAARAERLSLVDRPEARRVHQHPVPRIGGLGWAGAVIPVAVALGLVRGDLADWWGPLVTLVGFLLVGLADDLRLIRTRSKLLLQVGLSLLAACFLRWSGDPIEPFGALTFGAATFGMTALWVFAVLTVVNFLDGIDGITVAHGTVLLGLGAGLGCGPADGALLAIAVGALLGMGYWNATPARVFPGDVATHGLGFLIATLALEPAGGLTGRALPWPLATGILLPAVVDIGMGLAAKLRRGVPLARAHREHLYQRLTRAGDPHMRVALRYGALALLAAFSVAWVGPRTGWAGIALAVLLGMGGHLTEGLVRTRGLPYVFPGDVEARRSSQGEGEDQG
jgi:UDP-N-acetylmuramyl pentapeptide phosphotransferase/UDP-N-acetylglucosamine-1-phosphate transferase